MDPHSQTPDNELARRQRPLEMFRARTRRLSIHPREQLLLILVSVHLIFLPWALGTMHLWSQWTSLGLAVLSMMVALIPRMYTEDHTGETSFRLVMWPKLVHFPIFWLGLAFLLYVVCQALNPAWTYVQNERGVWWMQGIDHKGWLPSGVSVPMAKGGPWARLIVFLSVWLTVCALWVGVTRRRTLQILFTVIAANGVALALFGLMQRLLGNGKIFWFYESSNPSFFSSFIYKNHAGAYLNLTLAVTCGLAGWYYLRGLRRLEKSNPAGIFTFFATFIAVNVLISYSRGATMVMLLFLTGAIAGFLYQQITSPNSLRRPIIMISLVIFFGYFLKTGLEALNTGEAWSRFSQAFSSEDVSGKARTKVTSASLEMLGDHWVKGTGAGSYVFLFTTYQFRHAELLPNQILWEYAHNDIVQYPIEFGLLGMLLPLAAAIFLVMRLVRNFFWDNPLSICLLFGLGLTMGHAWFEFVFQNPAILLTACVLLATCVQFNDFEETATKG
ncbi:MAG: O-antigen ligase family protein [Opitutae bacterium]|nr:O-antigen ligase family protein [Opitutae bacterium]